MLRRVSMFLVAAVLCLTPMSAFASLSSYNQDFEGLAQWDPASLMNDGWLVFANVFNPDWSYAYNYGPFPAPNGGAGFCGIDVGQGGPEQGLQQLVVYNDYNNGGAHQSGQWLEANVFRQVTVGSADVGATWVFEFDAKRGNIEGTTTALAFIKTLDPNNGYAMTNFITADMTAVPPTWGHYSISITIDAGLVGQIFQYGFANTTTGYQGAGVFYDNLKFARFVPTTVVVEPKALNTKSHAPWVTASIELTGFDPMYIDIASLRLAGLPADAKYGVVGDRDGDLVPDLTVRFSYQALVPLLSVGPNVVTLTGALMTGETFTGTSTVKLVDPQGGSLAASVSPNPLNPAGTLSFRTETSGPVSVRMFDINGRLVRTILNGDVLQAGSHNLRIDGRDNRGASLPSGVYFYRIESPSGSIRGQFSVLK